MDEAGVYLRTPKLASDMLTTLTQGRSHGVFLGLCTHQPSDFTTNGMREEFQTNMFCNIILGANIKNAIDDVGKYFQLTEEEKDTLVLCGDDEDVSRWNWNVVETGTGKIWKLGKKGLHLPDYQSSRLSIVRLSVVSEFWQERLSAFFDSTSLIALSEFWQTFFGSS